ncbi:hypothetical protein ACVWVY_003402 [Bradyrhizobium sp. URHC0002]
MSVDRLNAIEWNGTELSGWIMINGAPTKVSADRDTIHTHARGFDDALTWEIKRHRAEIFEKLVPFFQRTASTQAQPRDNPANKTCRTPNISQPTSG